MRPGQTARPGNFFCGLVSLALALSVLAGCSTSASPVQRTFEAAVAPWVRGLRAAPVEAAGVPVQAGFDYLRVSVNGKPVWLARGYTDPAEGGVVSVWYSAQAEVLRLQRGRLAGLVGTPTSWVRVEGIGTAPPGPDLPDSGATWQRRVDQMPGHQWALQDTLQVRRIGPPADTQLAGLSPNDLVWVEEVDTRRRLPPSRYAWKPGQADPVYGEQCLKSDFCLAWQRWP